MKKVILIGDSIRQGYDKFVKMALDGSAEVYYPEGNCRFSQYVLRNFSDWVGQSKFGGANVDCVHWNAGLWDCLTMFEDGCLTPIDVYEQFIDRICKRIKLICPNAKVIFATSTPVNEEGYRNPNAFMRYNSDIEKYNTVAIEVVKKHGFEVNDLYALLCDKPLSYHSDMTHFYTRDAAELITNAVTEKINASIGTVSTPVDFDAHFVKKEDAIGI